MEQLKIIARCRDGRMVKGPAKSFRPNTDVFDVAMAEAASDCRFN